MRRIIALAWRSIVGVVLIAGVTGCAALDRLFCMHDCGRTVDRAASTPLVDYLYPTGDVPAQDAESVLNVPLVVGLTFLPSDRMQAMDAISRERVLAAIRARFRSLPYVRDIVIVPDHYLRPNGGFDGLQQIARLQRLDVIALVSYDQVSHSGENERAFAYLTIVGAYFVRGHSNETHTLLDLAVIDPASRSLILRAGGTSSLQGKSTAVEQAEKRRKLESGGLELATEDLSANLEKELDSFRQRIREGTAPVRVVKRSSTGGGGGQIDATLLALLLAAALAPGPRPARARASRGT
jgi:rhombotail lipoprotein